jgi:hypothetical protein
VVVARPSDLVVLNGFGFVRDVVRVRTSIELLLQHPLDWLVGTRTES